MADGRAGELHGEVRVMRRLTVITIGLLLVGAGQLCAQATGESSPAKDPFKDPFGNFRTDSNSAKRAPRTRGKSTVTPQNEPAEQAKKRALSEPADLFPPVFVTSSASSAHRRLENALNSETTFDYLDQPLKDVIEDISFSHNIPIVIDTKALEDYGIDTGTPITRALKGISLRSALRLMLGSLELTYVIRDEVLQITTPEAAITALSTRFYDVSELLPPSGDGSVLVELIKTLVAPDTWCGSEHIGAIIYVEHLESLAIRQTDDVFHEIETLLATTKHLVQKPPGKPTEVVGGTY